MKKLVLAILLIASPAWAQTKLLPKSVTARADPRAPIGRTADGKLVYSMKCENLPAPAPAGGSQSATGAGAGSATKRVFRSVLRKKATGRIGEAFPERTATQTSIHHRIGLCRRSKRS